MIVTFILDGTSHRIDTHSLTPLSRILKDDLDVAEFAEPCGSGQCGFCLVWYNEEPVNACLVPAFRLRGTEIYTAGGLQKLGHLHDIEQALADTGFAPCASCRDPLLILMYSLVLKDGDATAAEVLDALRPLTCECHDFTTLRDTLHLAALYRRRRIHGA
jgi:aerobic-type carbon monoxide dehydrogenase small subunit (CoxS/CutS family)